MPVEIRLPQLADDMSVAKVGVWLKREGDPVRAGEPIVEIETDKTNVEVEAPASGYLERIVVPAGSDDVAVNTVLAVIADERVEARTASISPASIGAFAPDPEPTLILGREPERPMYREPERTQDHEHASVSNREPESTQNHAPLRALHTAPSTLNPEPHNSLNPEPPAASITPLAREIARLAGLDLSLVHPASGGRITRRDVESALSHDGPPASPAPRAPFAPAAPPVPLAHSEPAALPAPVTPPEPAAPQSPLAASEPAETEALLAAPEPAALQTLPEPAAPQAPPDLAGPQAPVAVAEPAPPEAPLVAPEPSVQPQADEPGAQQAAWPELGSGTTVPPEPDAGPEPPEQSSGTAVPEVSSVEALFDVQPLTNVRRVTATRLQQAKQTVPHFYLEVECQVDALIELRSKWNARHAEAKLTVTDFVVFAASRALVQVPQANAAWAETAVRVYRSVDIAVAVNTAKGLLTPIVRGCQRKSIVAISREIAALAERTRAGQLRPDEYTGATFTVSNLGMYGVTSITPIVNPPAACILGVGTIEERPIVSDGRVVPGHTMRCTLAADHRAIDGATGAELMTALRRRLEDPLALTLEG